MLAWQVPRTSSSRLGVTPPAMVRQPLCLKEWLPPRVMSSYSTVSSSRVCSYDLINTAVTNGNHTATQSTFSSPCIPAHETNVTINGFNSDFRNTQPGTSGSILTVPINEQNANDTFWFFDYNTCGEGGVGVINDNESSNETLAGFSVRVFLLLFAILAPQLAAFHFSHIHIPEV